MPKSYAGFHLPVPDKDTWVSATGHDTAIMGGKKLSQTYDEGGSDYWRYNKEENQDLGAGFSKGVSNLELFGTKVANHAWLGAWNLAEHFATRNISDPKEHSEAIAKYEEQKQKFQTTKTLTNKIAALKSQVQTADFWLQSHPRDTVLGSLDGAIGENLAQLPLYEAIGAAGLGGKLGQSIKIGKPFVSGVTGEVGERVVQLSRSSLTEKLAQSKIGGWVAKRFIDASDGYLASLATSGGSTSEAKSGAIGFGAGGAAVEGAGKVLKVASMPLIKKWTANTVAMAGKPFAEELANSAMAEEEELLKHADSEPNKSTGEGLAFIKKQQELRSVNDPIMSKLYNVEKSSQSAIAQTIYGKKLNQLSQKQRTIVLARRMELIHEAASEAPVHLPELMKDEVKHNLDTVRKANPEIHAQLSKYEKMFGVDFAATQASNDIETVAKNTGTSNAPHAATRVEKADITTNPKVKKIDPKQFASLNSGSVSYMTAPRNRVEVANAVSDRSKAGLNKFIDLLKASTSNTIHFEDPAHLMLFHYANRAELPPAVSDSLLYRIRQTRGYENAKPADIRKEADWLHVHLLQMARTEHLTSEGNTFRSTKLGGPMSWTPWQKQLSEESDAIDIKSIQDSLKQHPHALKGFNTTIKTLRNTRANIKTPEDYLKYMRALSESSAQIKTHVTTGNAFIFNK